MLWPARSAIEAAAAKLENKGHQISEIELPSECNGLNDDHQVIWVVEAFKVHECDFRNNAPLKSPRLRAMLNEGELTQAVEALRMSLMEDSDAPDVQFHLAEALYRQGNAQGAIERYYIAAELDHNYIEAWTQIGCIYTELARHDSAIDAFDIALDIHPDYPDAHLHKAETLHQAGRTPEAVVHWRFGRRAS